MTAAPVYEASPRGDWSAGCWMGMKLEEER